MTVMAKVNTHLSWTRRVGIGLVVFALEVSLIATGLLMNVGGADGVHALLAWCALAVAYLGIGTFFARLRVAYARLDVDMVDVWDVMGLGRVFRTMFPVLIGSTGLIAGSYALIAAREGKEESVLNRYFPWFIDPSDPADQVAEVAKLAATFMKGTSAIAIILAWLMMQVSFARLYSWLCRNHLPNAVMFPGTPSPSFVDYLYLAFTTGTSLAVSDTVIENERMRVYQLMHCVIAFFYNTAVLAIGIKILSGG